MSKEMYLREIERHKDRIDREKREREGYRKRIADIRIKKSRSSERYRDLIGRASKDRKKDLREQKSRDAERFKREIEGYKDKITRCREEIARRRDDIKNTRERMRRK